MIKPSLLHKAAERHAGVLIFGILLVSMLGGLAQILPTMFVDELSTPQPGVQPYSALQLAGREVYQRESCGLCHTQQVRPLVAEVRRYGPFSRPGEFVYDRPFLWGSKRTGPDLHRLAGKYSDDWHLLHLLNPRSLVHGSIMPSYPWLVWQVVNINDIQDMMRALRRLGHDYSEAMIEGAMSELDGKTEMDAVIAYLQSLGMAQQQAQQP